MTIIQSTKCAKGREFIMKNKLKRITTIFTLLAILICSTVFNPASAVKAWTPDVQTRQYSKTVRYPALDKKFLGMVIEEAYDTYTVNATITPHGLRQVVIEPISDAPYYWAQSSGYGYTSTTLSKDVAGRDAYFISQRIGLPTSELVIETINTLGYTNCNGIKASGNPYSYVFTKSDKAGYYSFCCVNRVGTYIVNGTVSHDYKRNGVTLDRSNDTLSGEGAVYENKSMSITLYYSPYGSIEVGDWKWD